MFNKTTHPLYLQIAKVLPPVLSLVDIVGTVDPAPFLENLQVDFIGLR